MKANNKYNQNKNYRKVKNDDEDIDDKYSFGDGVDNEIK